MISSIKPITINLFPGQVTINRIDVNTSNWSKDVMGVKISYTLLSVEMRDWVQHFTRLVTTTDEQGVETTILEPIDITTPREHVAWSDSRTVLLTNDQWNNWPTGDQSSDDEYILQCVLENTGIEQE